MLKPYATMDVLLGKFPFVMFFVVSECFFDEFMKLVDGCDIGWTTTFLLYNNDMYYKIL